MGQRASARPRPRRFRAVDGSPLPPRFDGEGLVLIDNQAWIGS